MAHPKHHSDATRLAVVAAGAGLAYYGWKSGWFGALAVPGASSGGGAPAGGGAIPVQVPPTLLQPAASLPGTGASAASIAAAAPAQSTGIPVLLPAVPLNSTSTIIGSAGGTQIVAETPVMTPDGMLWPSNFATVNDPRTGVQPATQIVAASPYQSVALIQSSAAACPDNFMPEWSNNPAGIYGRVYNRLIDGVAATYAFLRDQFLNYPFNGTVYPNDLNSIVLHLAGPQALQTFVRLTGFQPTQVLDLTNPAVITKLLRAYVSVARQGDSYFNAIPQACMLAAYNLAFGTALTSLG